MLPVLSFSQVKNIGVPNITNYSKTEYKAGTQNWGIAQDRNGFIYFANNDGVVQFDGFHWELIDVPLSLTRSVFVDSKNRIFVGLLYDFGMLTKTEAGNYVFESLLDLVPEGSRNFSDIWHIHEINDKVVFQSYEKLFVYDDDRIEVISPNNKFKFSFKINNRLFVQDSQVGLFEVFNGFVDKVPWASQLKDFEIRSIIETGENELLIGTAHNGFYRYYNGELKVWQTELNQFVKSNKFYCSAVLSGNNLVVGTIVGGVVVADKNGQILQRINKDNGLQNNTVLSVFTDAQKNVWLGLDNGIDYLEVNSPVTFLTARGELGTGYCGKLFEGNLYLGTNQGLFTAKFNSIGLNNQDYNLIPNSVGQVWFLDEFDGELICGHNFGTFVVNNSTVTKISEIAGAWQYIRLKNYPDILLGGHYNGLSVLQKTGDGWRFKNKISGFEESSRFLFEDSDGAVWMGHSGKGIYRIKIDQNLEQVLEYKLYGETEGLPSNIQNTLFKLENKIYVSTVSGVFQYDKEEDKFKPAEEINKRFGLKERIKKVVSDENGNIYYIAESESGVLRKNEDLTYTKITNPFAPLQERFVNEFEFIYPINNDHMFLGIDNGFAHYSSKFPKSFVNNFQSFITKVELNYLDSVFYPQVYERKSHEYPFKRNSFRFHYTSPFFENLIELRFSYMLENYLDDWSEWTDDIYKDFNNLPYGEYAFKIKALNSYGVESGINEFKFEVLPPWYKTSLAYTIYVILLFSIVILIAVIIKKRIQRSKERELERHQKELKEKEENFKHEAVVAEKEIIRLRNDKLRADMVHRDKELVNQTNNIIQKNKFLQKLNQELKAIQANTDDATVKSKVVILKKRIDKEIDDEQQNKIFETYFDEVHREFFERLKQKYPQLSPRDLRLCAYIRMNISTKEISTLLNISYRGVEISRYRLRKKMELSRDINLSTFLAGI